MDKRRHKRQEEYNQHPDGRWRSGPDRLSFVKLQSGHGLVSFRNLFVMTATAPMKNAPEVP